MQYDAKTGSSLSGRTPAGGGEDNFPFHFRLGKRVVDLFQPVYDGSVIWLWYFGLGRVAVLLVVFIGIPKSSNAQEGLAALFLIFCAALGCSSWYLLTLYREQIVNATLTWTQVLLDFCVVAFTVSLTGGESSYYTFLLVIVILEAGILLGIIHAFSFAMVSLLFLFLSGLPGSYNAASLLPYWYNLLIQWIVMVAAAFISGYWNQRIGRLKSFQREILDNMVSGFLICDKNGTVILVNRAACAILDMDESKILNRPVAEILPCASGTECPVVTAIRGGRDYVRYEFLWQPEQGGPKMLGLTTNRICDFRGGLMSLIAVFQDLTETVALRQALRQQDRMAAVGESAAEFAHEIRNPLAALRSAVDEMQRGIASPDLTKRLCDIALRESEHLNNIVSGFLEFARNPEPDRNPVDINSLLAATAAAFEQTYPEITITLNCDESHPTTPGDTTRLRQMCDNILRNSAEAMSGKGEIVVASRVIGNHVEIRFDDTGKGISPDKAMRIFEPFYTEKENGIGMGLAVCMRIVTAFNGDIRAAARPGGGLSMIVRLPRLAA